MRDRSVARYVMGTLFTVVGGAHFVRPDLFEEIIPEPVPAKREWVYATGVWEVLGGVALLTDRCPRLVRWAMLALLAVVFPANVNQAINEIGLPDTNPPPKALLWARLPFQPVMMWAVVKATTDTAGSAAPAGDD